MRRAVLENKEINMQYKKGSTSLRSAVMRCRSPRAQRGASLLEAVAYLGIAAIVVIGAVALLNGAFNSAGTNELTEQVNAIQTGVKKLYMGQAGGYGSVNNAVLASAGVFPSTVPLTGGTATNTWGGNVTVSGDLNSFSIAYTNVPSAVCVNALTTGGSWISVTAGSTTITTFPVDPAAAQTDCGTGNTTITWTSS
jgi:hypothetical protein